jgi:hypothetical protein
MALIARCHCGAIQLKVETPPAEVASCNCSFCSKRGGLWAYYPAQDVQLLTSRDRVHTYQWNHYIGTHHHCGVCGCGTHSQFPDFSSGTPDHDKQRIAINARIFEDFDLGAVPVVKLQGRTEW